MQIVYFLVYSLFFFCFLSCTYFFIGSLPCKLWLSTKFEGVKVKEMDVQTGDIRTFSLSISLFQGELQGRIEDIKEALDVDNLRSWYFNYIVFSYFPSIVSIIEIVRFVGSMNTKFQKHSQYSISVTF